MNLSLLIALAKFGVGLLLVLCSLTPIQQQHPDASYYSAWSNEPVPPVTAKVPWWFFPCSVGAGLMVWGIVDVVLMKEEGEPKVELNPQGWQQPANLGNPQQTTPISPLSTPFPQNLSPFQGTATSQHPLTANQITELTTSTTPTNLATPTNPTTSTIPTNPTPSANPAQLPDFITKLLAFPAILLFGEMGGGKTSKAGYLAALHCQRGHRVEVIDPLLKAGRWRGLKVHGRGENYAQVTSCLDNFVKESSRRLKLRGEDENYDPTTHEQFYCLLCDEIDDWESEIDPKVMKAFISCCTSKLRQANMGVILIAHGDTITYLGGTGAAGGKKAAINRQFLKLETVAIPDASVPGGFRCAGYAYLHQGRQGMERVEIPKGMREPPHFDFRELVASQLPESHGEANGTQTTEDEVDPLWSEFEEYRQQFEE